MTPPENQSHSPYSRVIKSSAINDPERIYESPKDVLNDNRLDAEDKIEILESWAIDMESLMRAEEENMAAASSKVSSKAPEKLHDIKECLRQVQESAAGVGLSR